MINTKRTRIISLEEKHLEPLRKMRNDPTTWHWLTDCFPINPIGQKKWYEAICLDKSKLYLAVEDLGGQFIGLIRSDEWDRTNRSVRIGIDIVPAYRGKGFGTEVFSAFVSYLFEHQNMNRIWFFVVEGNEPAMKLYLNQGFRKEGKQRKAIWRDGKYHNYVMMSLLAREYSRRKPKKEAENER